MKITDRLKAEHGVLLWQLDHLQALVRNGAPRAILQAVVETIAGAEQRHVGIEERLLYPALVKAVGREFPLLQSSRAEHRELRQASTRVQSGSFDEEAVEAFVKALRAHLEREIHDVFALAEEMIPAERLAAMSNWDVDHIYEVYAKRRHWVEQTVGMI